MDHARTRSHRLRAAAALAAGAAAVSLSLSLPAAAAPCGDLKRPVVVVGSGKVIIADLAKALSALGIHVIYKLEGSCLAVDAILNGTSAGLPGDTATYWTSSGEQSCNLDPSARADIAISDVFASTCQPLPNGLPSNVHDFQGPIEAYTFVVPKGSTQRSISKAAAYFVFGFGKDSGVEPWTDEDFIFHRSETSGTQQMFAAAIGVPPERWKGKLLGSSGEIVSAVSATTQPEKAIGILTAEVSGANLPTLDVLAYQDASQNCGYWPDATPVGSDKQNVRDGHYALWGPLHLLTQVDARGYAVSPDARDVIAYLTGTKIPPNGLDLIALLAHANIIPQCAMHVRRDSELGPLTSFSPERPCGCYFDELASGKDTCAPCTSDVTCPLEAAHCNYGYCEAE
jgi:hypothetical protein